MINFMSTENASNDSGATSSIREILHAYRYIKYSESSSYIFLIWLSFSMINSYLEIYMLSNSINFRFSFFKT